MNRIALTLVGMSLLISTAKNARWAIAADDAIKQTLKEQQELKQQQSIREFERQNSVRQLNRDQKAAQDQQDITRNAGKPAGSDRVDSAETNKLQRQLDQSRTEDSLQKLQRDEQLRNSEKQSDSLWRQHRLDALQRQQQIDFLNDQIRQNQQRQDLDRSR